MIFFPPLILPVPLQPPVRPATRPAQRTVLIILLILLLIFSFLHSLNFHVFDLCKPLHSQCQYNVHCIKMQTVSLLFFHNFFILFLLYFHKSTCFFHFDIDLFPISLYFICKLLHICKELHLTVLKYWKED